MGRWAKTYTAENPHRGEGHITVAGVDVPVLYDLDALARMNKVTGTKGLVSLGIKLADPAVDDVLACFVVLASAAGGEVTKEELAELRKLAPSALQEMSDGLGRVLEDASKVDGEPVAARPQTKAGLLSSGTSSAPRTISTGTAGENSPTDTCAGAPINSGAPLPAT